MTKRFEYRQPRIVNGSWNRDAEDDIAVHPSPPTQITLYLPYLEATSNNVAAALLLDYFSYYCTRMSSLHGMEWITLSIQAIQEDFMGAFGRTAINRALDLLIELNLLERQEDPDNPLERSRQYRVNFHALEKLRSQDRPVQVLNKPEKGQAGTGFGAAKPVSGT
jgi:hypothetical protein